MNIASWYKKCDHLFLREPLLASQQPRAVEPAIWSSFCWFCAKKFELISTTVQLSGLVNKMCQFPESGICVTPLSHTTHFHVQHLQGTELRPVLLCTRFPTDISSRNGQKWSMHCSNGFDISRVLNSFEGKTRIPVGLVAYKTSVGTTNAIIESARFHLDYAQFALRCTRLVCMYTLRRRHMAT